MKSAKGAEMGGWLSDATYLLGEVSLLLAAAVAVGVVVGWLLFRAGRTTVGKRRWERIQTDLGTADGRIRRAEQARLDAEAMTQRHRHELVTRDRVLKKIEKQRHIAEIDMTDAQSRLDQLQAEVNGLHDHEAVLAGRVVELEARSGSLANGSNGATGSNGSHTSSAPIQQRLAAKDDEIERLRGQLRDRDEQLREAGSTQAELERLRERLESTKPSVRTREGDETASALELQSELESARAQLLGRERSIGALQAALERCEATVVALRGSAAEIVIDEAESASSAPPPLVARTDVEMSIPGPDDLTRIKGVGPKLEQLLHAQGIRSYRQIASMNDAAIDDLQARLPEFPDRVRRDGWVDQARRLLDG